MKRIITIAASFSGKISVGQYENSQPFFSASEVSEMDFDTPEKADQYIKERQDQLQAICSGNFEAEALKAKINKIKADRKDFRWYAGLEGDYPSVTSILGYDSTFFASDEELREYAAQWNIIHAQVAEYIKTGEWKDANKVDGLGADLFIIKTGKLGLSLDGWDFLGLCKKFKVTNLTNGTPVVSEKHKYGGLPDIPTCLVDGVKTLADIKRTVDKTKNLIQMSAYEMARREMGQEPNEQIAIFPLNDKTERGFSTPVATKEIEKYFDMFLYKRREFAKVYSI